LFSSLPFQRVHCYHIEKLLDFCMLILHPATLLKVFIRSKSFLLESSRFSKYSIKSSANRDSLISFFPICILFICFSCFVALAKISSTILNKSDESENRAQADLELSILLPVPPDVLGLQECTTRSG
jgi:hypothetical protein